MKLLLAAFFFFIFLFCCYGFLASYEVSPTDRLPWQAGYTIGALTALTLAVRTFLRR